MKNFGNVTAILCQEGGIGCGVVLDNMTTSNIWLKTMLKTLDDRVGGVNSLGHRRMAVGTEANSWHRGLGGECWYGEVEW